jgi:hypothetical protein
MTGTAQGEWERRGNQVWVNPLRDWSNAEMAEYRREHELPISDVTALTHRSGECNCMAFASKGEPEFVAAMYPDWFAENIEPLQAAARERGLERCDWGWGAGDPPVGGVRPALSRLRGGPFVVGGCLGRAPLASHQRLRIAACAALQEVRS